MLYWYGSPEKSQSYQASIQCWAIICPPAERHFNGVLEIACWLADDCPFIAVFGSSFAHQLKKERKIIKFGPPLTKTFWIHAWNPADRNSSFLTLSEIFMTQDSDTGQFRQIQNMKLAVHFLTSTEFLKQDDAALSLSEICTEKACYILHVGIHTGKCIRRFGGIYAYCRFFIDRKW